MTRELVSSEISERKINIQKALSEKKSKIVLHDSGENGIYSILREPPDKLSGYERADFIRVQINQWTDVQRICTQAGVPVSNGHIDLYEWSKNAPYIVVSQLDSAFQKRNESGEFEIDYTSAHEEVMELLFRMHRMGSGMMLTFENELPEIDLLNENAATFNFGLLLNDFTTDDVISVDRK